MGTRIDLSRKYNGFQLILLENELLTIHLFPELGARIYSLIYKPKSCELLWHHPSLKLNRVPYGASYDDNFFGGWEELFPNDAPMRFNGRNLPDHGELWSQAWDYKVVRADEREVTIYLQCKGVATNAIVEKWITLRACESIIHFRHSITNLDCEVLEFLWKFHPALRVTEFHRVDVPGRRAEYVGTDWSRLKTPALEFDWPITRSSTGETADLRFVLPASAGKRDFVYVKELYDGWCAITDRKNQVGFGLVFPKDIFKWVWLFMPAGGWRGLHMVILEPCTSYPKDLSVASIGGNCARLEPGGILKFETLGVVFSGITGVQEIDMHGNVTPSRDDNR